MFRFKNILSFHRSQKAAPALQTTEQVAVVKTKESNHHTLTVLETGELIIAHKFGSDLVQLNAEGARALRNLLGRHDVRKAIGAPYTPTPPKSPEKKARRAARKAETAQGELLAYYEDMASIDPGFAVPTDADLEALFQERRGLQRAS